MSWMALAALAMLGLALMAGLVIVILTSVNSYARKLTDEPKDLRRGFDVKPAASGDLPRVPEELK